MRATIRAMKRNRKNRESARGAANAADPWTSLRVRRSVALRVGEFTRAEGLLIGEWTGRALLRAIGEQSKHTALLGEHEAHPSN